MRHRAEWFIMKDFDWSRFTFKCLTIERPSQDLQNLLQSHGYRKVMDIARGDTLWAHESVYEAASKGIAINPHEIRKHHSPNLPSHAKPMAA